MVKRLEDIKGVGPKLMHQFRSQGIWSIYDLLLRFPKGYENFYLTDLKDIKHKDSVTLECVISSDLSLHRYGKTPRVTFKCDVDHQTFDAIAFGKGYLVQSFKKGDLVILKGVYNLYYHQINVSSVTKPEKRLDLKPIYGLSDIYDKTITNIISEIYLHQDDSIYEVIPEDIYRSLNYISRKEAFYKIHLPKNEDDIMHAKLRFKFEEAFFLQLKWMASRPNQMMREPKAYDIHQVRSFIEKIPFELTKDQKEAVNDIFRDFKKNVQSFRLIQGDVGSGKTIVSLIAAYAIMTAKEQVAFMAPTELLVNQHYQFFTSMIHDFKILRLTSSTKNKEKEKMDLELNHYDMVIGTHALIEEDVKFRQLGLVIIDEQHKFGVEARQQLIDKALHKDVLYLTATPIPRTLAMVVYGDSHVSAIKEKPKQRKLIETQIIHRDDMTPLIEDIKLTIAKKEHVYLVVPAIHSDRLNDNMDTILELLNTYGFHHVYMLHGEQSKEENESSMKKFIENQGSILLSTSMIEVGIDLPTATMIAIFSAERFGLAQLHQLRGRVGRSHLKSVCYLVTNGLDHERLDVLKKTQDGFKLSEFDLKQRGPGDFIGLDQSGFPEFKFLDLQTDYDILLKAQEEVLKLLNSSHFKTNQKYRYLNRFINEDLKL
ncbi:MAG: ATP-dependent DNA helicase RecG [Acholeplasmataceae bacterium]|jgi:ATP-dependent DNA helicase RecG|nr:ATP-dependent DNA helicase RecG [Acholeplasmataceae bacterium]